jgi:hypothetical protein
VRTSCATCNIFSFGDVFLEILTAQPEGLCISDVYLSAMRGKLDAEALIKIILILVAIWLVLKIFGEAIGLLWSIFGIFHIPDIIGLIIILVIILWLLDYI